MTIMEGVEMQAIFASKFYKSSKRQDAIRAAISDPINVELVQQLSEYLDEEYKHPQSEEPTKETSEPETDAKPEDSEDVDVNVNVSSTPSSAPSAPHRADHHLSDMMRAEEVEGGEPPVAETETTEVKEETTEVSESTDVPAEPVMASEIPMTNPVISIADQTDSIMGLLNGQDSTAGVRLVSVKVENELWVYYKDSINLNNVMEPTIASLNSADYGHLDFNRLARTDNAIVFDITQSTKPVEPIKESDEK